MEYEDDDGTISTTTKNINTHKHSHIPLNSPSLPQLSLNPSTLPPTLPGFFFFLLVLISIFYY
jgi:hypothetical protein